LAGLPPEPFFVLSASAQYLGAVLAYRLFDDLAPAGVAWLRVVGAAIVLVAVSAPRLLRGGRWSVAEVRAAAVFGAAVAFMNLTFYLAIDRMDMGKGVAIEFIGPICVAALATRTRRNTLALAFAVSGVALLSGLEINREPLGLLWIFLASACWAAYIVVGARVARLDRGLAGLGVGLVFGAVLIAPFGAPSSGPAWSSPALLLAAMSVGVLSNAIGYGLEQSILRAIPVRRFSVLLALLPVTATVFGAVFLDQIPSVADLVGIGLVLVGVVVQQRDVIEPPAD
jgi:inner membrane transporter RhtA